MSENASTYYPYFGPITESPVGISFRHLVMRVVEDASWMTPEEFSGCFLIRAAYIINGPIPYRQITLDNIARMRVNNRILRCFSVTTDGNLIDPSVHSFRHDLGSKQIDIEATERLHEEADSEVRPDIGELTDDYEYRDDPEDRLKTTDVIAREIANKLKLSINGVNR